MIFRIHTTYKTEKILQCTYTQKCYNLHVYTQREREKSTKIGPP